MKKRSSILLYFDNYHLVASLPDDQFALLFRALLDFSELEVNGGGADLFSFPDRYPGMRGKTIGFFYFMADNVRRDAMTYNEKRANYQAAALKREAERTHGQAPPNQDTPRECLPGDPLPREDMLVVQYLRSLREREEARRQEDVPAAAPVD